LPSAAEYNTATPKQAAVRINRTSPQLMLRIFSTRLGSRRPRSEVRAAIAQPPVAIA
jgi:hypothetical protein